MRQDECQTSCDGVEVIAKYRPLVVRCGRIEQSRPKGTACAKDAFSRLLPLKSASISVEDESSRQ